MITDLPGSTTTGVNFDIIVQEFERKGEDSLGSCVQQTSGLSKGHPSEGIVDADSWMRGWTWTDMDMCRWVRLTVGYQDWPYQCLSTCLSACLPVCMLPVQQASASKQARQAKARQRRSKQRSKASKDAMQSYVCCQAMEWTRLRWREYIVSSPCTEIPCNAMECHAKFQIVSLCLLLLPPCRREGKLEPFRKQLETPENLATYFSMILALLALPVSW